MKAELLKKLFKAIASSDSEAVTSVMEIIIEEERDKGHNILADQLANIKKKNKVSSIISQESFSSESSLSQIPVSSRFNQPLVTIIPRERLRNHIILAPEVERAFQRIEKEYGARDRLAHHGLPYRQKILFYGSPGCGKTLGVERLAWKTGLTLLKVRFDAMISSFLGDTANNLRIIFDKALLNPCLLFLDECDTIAKSREDIQEVGEIKRVVNTFLQLLDEYQSSSGLIVAATNLDKAIDSAVWRRFDDIIELPIPGERELELIMKQTLSGMELGSINWSMIIKQMIGFSGNLAVKIAQNAAKQAILDRQSVLTQSYLEQAILELKIFSNRINL